MSGESRGAAGAMRAWVKAHVSPRSLVRLRCLTRGLPLPRWGNLRRTRPLSDSFGFDRGTPLDRYYLHRFFERERAAITGRVLEIQSPGHALRFGHDLAAADSIDIDPRYAPTYLCDLAQSQEVVPDNSYDCFLLPNTLCHLERVDECLRQALRIVRPGGVILASAAAFVPLTADARDYWHLSADGWRAVAGRAWGGHEVRVEQHGNCLAAVAAMLGLAHEELDPEELNVHDPRYPVLVTLRCRKEADASASG
ncbi:MAG: methyltransferase domain-containing protein [Vicinamibacterales bacterium]